jgi:type IV pilus assembly protein PilP
MRRGSVLFGISIGLLALVGCGEKSPEGSSTQKVLPIARPVQPAPQPSLPQPGPLAPKEKPPLPNPVEKSKGPISSYNAMGKPDPFLPAQASRDSHGEKKTPVLPLEQFEVSDFELVGVIIGSGLKKAMVQDPTNKGFLIQIGTPIGKRGGKVIQIADKEVIIEETFLDFMGRKSSRKISLKLPQPK